MRSNVDPSTFITRDNDGRRIREERWEQEREGGREREKEMKDDCDS
jgi:hypothetical protein